MYRLITIKLLLVAILFSGAGISQENKAEQNGQDKNKTQQIYVFDIKEKIAKPIWRKTQMALEEARKMNTDHIIIDMNTYGGQVNYADSLRSALLRSQIPVTVFINNNAASAGALISIACDSIYMLPGANIGAATVVNQSGEKMPDKYQSYMRATMRSTAEANNRDPQIAEAMVDASIEIEGIIEEGKVLTFTTEEAIEHGFCEGKATSISQVIQNLGIKDYEITKQRLTATDKIIGFLISPVVSGVLIMVIIGGIYFELQSPGLGFPAAAAILAALLYFAPLYLEGLAANWEILLFIGGILLILLELFVITGFGVAGVSGLLLMITGLTLSMVDNFKFNFTIGQLDTVAKAFFTVATAMLLSLIGSFYLGKKMFTTTTFGHLALDSVQDRAEGYTSEEEEYTEVIGQEGTAHTVLRPAGKVEVNDDIYDAFAEAGFIDKGSRVKITGYTNTQLKVRKID
ncbi:MAG: nodulation protein NfeD [Bacteroidales bacterium]|nr:nodulation protein NfeD [Bacteroidales bacterium]MCF8334216.1 nodulation protein NfeD [Bacteroidales bacterium]